MPVGLYRLSTKPVGRGVIVGACIPNAFVQLARERGYLSSGSCPSGIRPVMKYVAALPGDSVEIRLQGMLVNGKAIPNTDVVTRDSRGRALPNQLGRHIVQPGEYWLVSNLERGSFDSRYYGPVTEILGVVAPLRTENELPILINLFNVTRF